MDLQLVKIENPNEYNLILGMAHFIKTVEDIHELMVSSIPNAKFGLAFCEASGPGLIRTSGTDPELIKLASENALKLSAGHSFIIFIKDAYPINVLPALKQVPEVVRLFCATANPVQAIMVESEQGRGIMGVIDGMKSTGVEDENGKKERHEFLRAIGYKM